MKNFPSWLATGLLYGLSWPILEGINLSFLAWFAFVPLFVYLERNRDSFRKSLAGSYAAMLVFGLLTAGWLFSFPQAKGQIAVIVLLEVAYFTFPVIPFFFLRRKIGFDRALWLFPLIWTVWEWLYLDLEFTMGTHLSPYSQSSNTWLVQYVDLTGMWGVSFWLLLFNVVVYKAYKMAGSRVRSMAFVRSLVPGVLLLLGLPLLYAAWTIVPNTDGREITVSLLPTRYDPETLSDPALVKSSIEEILHRNDSLAYEQAAIEVQPDLYLWPETGLGYVLGSGNLGDLLMEAVNDWDAALLTGARFLPFDGDTTDLRYYTAGILLSPRTDQPEYHLKTVMTPGQEVIPYHRQLARIPGFPIAEEDQRYLRRGSLREPLHLRTRQQEDVEIGVSLCFEQWYPTHWTELARNGAEFYAHLAGEGWYGNVGFQTFMAGVGRLRAIENRKAVARCANVGISGFIGADGVMRTNEGNDAMTRKVPLSAGTTFYARHPHWFPVACLIVLIILGTVMISIAPPARFSSDVGWLEFGFSKQKRLLN